MNYLALYAGLAVDYTIWGRKRQALSRDDWHRLMMPQLLLGAPILLVWNPWHTTSFSFPHESWILAKSTLLYRNFRDYVTLNELDLEVHLVKEGEVLSRQSRSHQKFIHGIKVLMAKNYVDNLSEETRKGMNEKVAQGGYPHRAPAGYRNDKATRTVVVDPDKAAFVRRMF